MAWTKILSYAVDFIPAKNNGIVYFRCDDGNDRKTPAFPPETITAICQILQAGPTVFEVQQLIFRSAVYNKQAQTASLMSIAESDADELHGFKEY